MIKQCARCGKEFDARGSMKYCSDDCRVEARRERCRRWRRNNPDKVLEYQRQWRAANPEKAYEQVKRFRKRHPDIHNEQRKRWRKRHPDKARAQLNRWREKHREYFNAYMRNYRKKNHARLKAWRKTYLAKKKHLRWVAERSARLRKILEEKAAARQAAQPKRERHWTDDVSFPLVSSCQATLIY